MIQRLQAKRNEEGFTLIELLIVIIVLGILAAIVVFAVGSTKKDAVASACKTAQKSVQLSAEGVNVHEGSYPVGSLNSANAAPLLSGGTNGALLKEWPQDNDFIMQYVGTATSYNVYVFPKTFHVKPAGVVNIADDSVAATPLQAVQCSALS